MSPSDDAWSALAAGDTFRITSVRGNAYELVFLAAIPERGICYVRQLPSRVVARLEMDRLRWDTLSIVGPGDPCTPGDEIIATSVDGVTVRGVLREPIDERIVVRRSGAEDSLPVGRLDMKSFRLLFVPKGVHVGDEFVVRSKSGHEYRGVIQSVRDDRYVVTIAGREDRVSMYIDHLEPKSLRVLVPVPVSTLSCSPSP